MQAAEGAQHVWHPGLHQKPRYDSVSQLLRPQAIYCLAYPLAEHVHLS